MSGHNRLRREAPRFSFVSRCCATNVSCVSGPAPAAVKGSHSALPTKSGGKVFLVTKSGMEITYPLSTTVLWPEFGWTMQSF